MQPAEQGRSKGSATAPSLSPKMTVRAGAAAAAAPASPRNTRAGLTSVTPSSSGIRNCNGGEKK